MSITDGSVQFCFGISPVLGPEAHTYLHLAQEDQGPEILRYWPGISRASKATLVQFDPCQSLVSVPVLLLT